MGPRQDDPVDTIPSESGAGRGAPFELVIFDCDGVLVDSERLVVEIEALLLTELGWPITVGEVVERFMGRSDDHMNAEIESRIGRAGAEEFDRRATAEVRRALADEVVAVDGVREAVARLRDRGVATCVASSGSHRKMRLTLGRTGLLTMFEGRIFSAAEVERGKPFPDLFLHAARELGAEPRRCAVVEDSRPGVEAAVAAGMAAFGYGGGLAGGERLAAAGATVFDHMDDLDRALDAAT